MARKVLIFILCITLICMIPVKTYAYQDFQEITKVGNGKFIDEFTNDDYEAYYKNFPKYHFLGWKVYYANQNMKVKFISETLFSYYNNGKSAINYQYKSTKKVIDEYHLKATGSLKIKTMKNNKIFGDGLDAAINLEYKTEHQEEQQENYDIKVSIEPGTQLVLYMYGEGKITNGVAKRYFLFFEVDKGGFEIFIVTTHYQRLEITPI